MDAGEERTRYFIVTPGRTGSTLLCVVLADSGADFGMAVPESWESGTGEMEHPELRAAVRHFAKAYRISSDKPVLFPTRYVWDLYRHLAKRRLARALRAARFAKAESLDLAVQPAFKLGYFPRVILNYRRFEPHALSRFQRRGHSSIEELIRYYDRVCRNGLLLLHLYGGCVVSYEELTDPSETGWASALAEVTGLEASSLLAARARRLKSHGEPEPVYPLMAPSCEATFRELEKLRGRAIAPSSQALRSWERKLGKPTAC